MSKVKIGITAQEVEVNHYRPFEKGCLRGFFSLIIYPEGQKIIDCRYFEQGDRSWWNFPQKELKYTDGRKSEFIPFVTFLSKDYMEQLKIAVLTALKDLTTQAPNVHPQVSRGHTHQLPFGSPFSQGEAPF
jgi:hypothetical protein